MSDLLLVLGFAVVLIVGVLFWYFSRKSKETSIPNGTPLVKAESGEEGNPADLVLVDLPLSFSNLATTPDMSKLVQIKDVEVVSRLNAVIPNAMNAVAQFANKIPKNAVLIDIPYKDLVKSKAVDGAKRAMAMGKDGIAKNANLTQIDLAKSAQLANIASGVMNVAALVVGQQMMSEINSKLAELNEGIDRLQEIAVAELKSKILANLALVMEISNAQVEIIENLELRQNKLNSIDGHKKSVVQLLGQVNLMIENIISNPDYRVGSKGFNTYQENVKELNDLISWQRTLVSLLEQISKLSHALSLGVISLEKSNAVFHQYLELSEKINERLSLWHDKQIKSLQINIQDGRAGKGAIEKLPGLIIQDLKYLKVTEEVSASIGAQQNSHFAKNTSQVETFESDVQLVLIDGTYYYKPNQVDG